MEAEDNQNKDLSKREQATGKITRLVVTKEAEVAVGAVMDAVNDGFDAGRATKIEVASYMLLWFKNNVPDDVKLSLRMTLANEMTMLESVVKKARISGGLPPALKEALAQHFFGSDGTVSKKLKKSLKLDTIIDSNRKESAD